MRSRSESPTSLAKRHLSPPPATPRVSSDLTNMPLTQERSDEARRSRASMGIDRPVPSRAETHNSAKSGAGGAGGRESVGAGAAGGRISPNVEVRVGWPGAVSF